MASIERVTTTTVVEAVPLVAAQLEDHAIPLATDDLRHALLGLVDNVGRGAVLLAREGETAIGVAVMSYVWSLEHGGLSAWLDELFVSPEHRDAGVGKALLDHACALARDAGCIGFDLEVARGHERADHLYERAGFHRVDRNRWARKVGPAGTRPDRLPGRRPIPTIDHISLGTNDLARARRFYDAALAPLGLVGYPQPTGDLGYGPASLGPVQYEGFALYVGFEDPSQARPVVPAAGFHVALNAPSREAVRAFHRAALEAGGTDLGAPGLRPQYHADYYGAFVADPDGHHVEAVCHAPER